MEETEKIILYCGSLDQLNSRYLFRRFTQHPQLIHYLSPAYHYEPGTKGWAPEGAFDDEPGLDKIQEDIRKKGLVGLVDYRTIFHSSDSGPLMIRVEGTPIVRCER